MSSSSEELAASAAHNCDVDCEDDDGEITVGDVEFVWDVESATGHLSRMERKIASTFRL